MGRSTKGLLSLVARIRAPTVERGDRRPPILFLLHGVGGNELAMAALAPEFDPRFIVVSVRSPVEIGPFAFAWYPVDFTPEGPEIDAEAARTGWERLNAFIDEAVGRLDADPTRVFVAGFSQGGILSIATVLTAPERIAGAVCMSGRLPPELVGHAVGPERLRGKPLLIVHGSRDRTLPVEYGRQAQRALSSLPLDVEYREFDIGHETSPQSIDYVSAWLSVRLDA
jgi:phospholipase/carboxylesterase